MWPLEACSHQLLLRPQTFILDPNVTETKQQSVLGSRKAGEQREAVPGQKNGGAEDTKRDPMNVQWGPKGGSHGDFFNMYG